MKPPTEKQLRVLRRIAESVRMPVAAMSSRRDSGYPRARSMRGMTCHAESLERKGLLERDVWPGGGGRCLRITPVGYHARALCRELPLGVEYYRCDPSKRRFALIAQEAQSSC